MTLPAFSSSASTSSPIREVDQQQKLKELRALRNAVIGSRTRKGQVVVEGKVPELIDLLRIPIDSLMALEIRSLAATIIGSLAHSASPPTLLALLRAGAPSALFSALADVGRSSIAATDSFKIIEALLRSIRSLLLALADQIAPHPRYGVGFGRDGKSEASGSARGKSSREAMGWGTVNAGLKAAKGGQDITMTSASSSNLRSAFQTPATTNPRQELTVLARVAIAGAFSVETVPVLLGTLFLAPIPRDPRADQTFLEAKAASITRSRSPAMSTITGRSTSAGPTFTPASPASVAMSAVESDLGHSDPAFGSGRGSTPLSERVRILGLVEMVCGVLSVCLGIPGLGNTDVRGKASLSSRVITPEIEISRRRRRIVDFRQSDSPFLRLGSRADVESTLDPSDPTTLEVLLDAAECGFPKTQEAALWALAELTRDNSETSVRLFKYQTPSGLLPTSMLLALRKEPNPQVRLAAFCCLAHIIKAHPFTAKTNERVLAVLVELLDHPGDVQVAATFAIAKIVADDPDLQVIACNSTYNSIAKLAHLMEQACKQTSGIPASTPRALSRLHGTVDGAYRLQEGVMTALAALSYSRDDMRRRVIDHEKPALLPLVVPLICSGALGTRIAACRLVRALSRSISILRTSLVDAGIAERLTTIIKDDEEHPDVRIEATATICNLVLAFSPLRTYLSEHGGVSKLVQLCQSSDGPIRLNALWAIKNVVYASEVDFKAKIMAELGYDTLASMARGPATLANAGSVHANLFDEIPPAESSLDSDDQLQCATLQEQALNIMRNLASTHPDDIERTFQGFGGASKFLDVVEDAIWSWPDGRDKESSRNARDLVLEQCAYILVNVATGLDTHRLAILNRPNLLDALCSFLSHPRVAIRIAGVWAALNLTAPLPEIRSESALSGAVKAEEVPLLGGLHPSSGSEMSSTDPKSHADASDSNPTLPTSRQPPSSTTAAASSSSSSVSAFRRSVPAEAIHRLKRFGFEMKLAELLVDEEREVSERARILLARFREIGSGGEA